MLESFENLQYVFLLELFIDKPLEKVSISTDLPNQLILSKQPVL
jgi:hypothetical protein